jgi:hypothetical protein
MNAKELAAIEWDHTPHGYENGRKFRGLPQDFKDRKTAQAQLVINAINNAGYEIVAIKDKI